MLRAVGGVVAAVAGLVVGCDSAESPVELCGGGDATPMEFWFEAEPASNGGGVVVDETCNVTRIDPVGDAEGIQFDCQDGSAVNTIVGRFILMNDLLAQLGDRVHLQLIAPGDSEYETWFAMRNVESELLGVGIQAQGVAPSSPEVSFAPLAIQEVTSPCPAQDDYCGTRQALAVEVAGPDGMSVLGDSMASRIGAYEVHVVAALEETAVAGGEPQCEAGTRRQFAITAHLVE